MTELKKFDFKQGFNRETTQYAEEGSWYDGNYVRFRAGRPQNLRGYEPRAEGTTFDGSGRALQTWIDNKSQARAIFGTPDKLYESNGDQIYDITPIATVVTIATGGIFTTEDSALVTISLNGHPATVGDYVLFTSTSDLPGGISLSGNTYQIKATDGDDFTISVSPVATSTTNKGSAEANFYIPTGYSVRTGGYGYGAAAFTAASAEATIRPTLTIKNIHAVAGAATIRACTSTAHGRAKNDTVYFVANTISISAPTPGTGQIAVPGPWAERIGGNLQILSPWNSVTQGGVVSAGGPQFTLASVSGTKEFFIICSSNASANQTVTGASLAARAIFTPVQTATTIGRGWDQAASTDNAGITFDITNWSLDNWNNATVLANRKGLGVWKWETTIGTPGHAVSVYAPASINSIVVSPNDRHLICLGANRYEASTGATISGTFDPMLVRWSDQDDYTEWTPKKTTSSGEVLLTDGTEIVGGVRSKNNINIWTTNSLWLMQWVGRPAIFRFDQAGTNCGMVGQHAGIDFNGVTYWMGYGNFYRYTGQVETLKCTVRRYIFDDINRTYYDKVYAGINSEFNEIIWLYPSSDSNECNRYVIFNPVDDYWVYGEMIFTTFADKEVFGNTITTGVTASGNNLYNNEPPEVFTGTNNSSLVSYIESADFDVADGNQIMFMNRIIPDYEITGGTETIKMKITTKQFPEASSEIVKSFDITNSTKKVDFRARGRQGQVRVSCNGVNGISWRWGSIRLGVAGDGRR
tara:strand:+ start:305 stop:2563 length:2259 start_codon:yes stop_codon:yes gene_type:complete